MKDYINIKHVGICIGALALILIATLIIINIEPSEEAKYKEYAKETTLLTAGDDTMSLDEGVFLTKNKQAYYEASYLAQGYSLDWSVIYTDNKTFEQVVLDESLEFVKQIFLFSEYAMDNNITLTDEEIKSVEADVKEFLSSSSETVIKATLADEDLLERIYTRTAYYNKVCELICEDADLTVTDEEARQCLVTAIEISPLYFDSPDRTANKILERVKSGEIITQVAKIYDAEATEGHVGLGDMNGDALEKLCLSLGDGECGMVEIDGTYFVVYCHLANDTEAAKEAKELILEEKKNEVVKAFFAELQKDIEITVNEDAWDTINFDNVIFTEEDLNATSSKK
ncbi:MAG: hypothetical protein IJP13_03030 [Lachnospiraceae bacterium]|nr:hypothetical protein [Lachnospiraceae bacterium]